MYTRLSLSALLTLILLGSGAFAISQKDLGRAIGIYMKPLADKHQFSGVVLAVSHGKVVYERAFGLASAELSVPNRIDTKFNIASITKSFTKIIAIRLVEEKKLALTDKLSKFVPDFPRGDDITVEMLLQHRAGIPHRVIRDEEDSLNFTTEEMVDRAKQAKLLFEPGTKSIYSSAGYTVLTRVLEIASGKTYTELLNEMVFGPAGMKDSVEPDGEHFIAGRAQDYLLESDGIIPAELKNYTALAGAGSVFSTARDIYDFDTALMAGKFGEGAKQSLTSDGAYTNNGLTNGFRAYTAFDSVKGYAFVVVSNLASGSNDMIIRDLPLILMGQDVAPASVPTVSLVANTGDNLSDFVGTYDLNGSRFNILAKAGKLYAGEYRLYPVRKDTYYSFGHWAEIKFNRDASGNVISSEWTSPSWKVTWNRVI